MLQSIQARLLSVHKWLLPKQQIVIKLLFLIEIALIGSAIGLIVYTLQDPFVRSQTLLDIGGTLGTIAVILFLTTLLPGIFQRLRWLPQITLPLATIIVPYRRHIGILMFLTAWVHMLFASTLQTYILTGSIFPPAGPRLFEVFGTLAWLLLFPVWLTSNDTSMRFLGRKWKLLQRLTYIAVWLIMIHVGLQGEKMAALIGLVGSIELLSWIVAKRR
jgi:DMSO/TMAO reductase YedYZ heme-binding membrane subunit